ncbi:MAG: DNA translocase FtsK [Planctomycetes bacterium]|nr:DNA translocase FtsK [Planctomycetota bacterium]
MGRKKKMSEPEAQVNHVALGFFGIAFCTFLLVSLISYDVSDWPNPDVAPSLVEYNLCGRTGAVIAYFSNYYLGPGGMLVLVAAMIWLVLYVVKKPVEQFLLRLIGVLLIGAALSASYFVVSPGSSVSLSQGNGGILGIALGHFLLHYTAFTGASLIIGATMLVGLLLAADNLVLLLPALLVKGVDGLRQAGPVLAGAGARAGSYGSKARRVMSDSKKMLTIATSQQEAAIREVSSLDEEEEEPEDLFEELEEEEEDEEETEEVEADAAELSEEQAAAEKERMSSVAAVSDALARMRGILGKPSAPSAGTEVEDFSEYKFPPADLLEAPVKGYSAIQEKVVRKKGQVLEQTLEEFNIDAKVVEMETGPVITMFELQLAPGIKVAQISNLANDLARSLGAPAVRVVAPLPGRHTIGIEVPNSEKEKVRIKELIELGGKKIDKMQIPLFLGKDASGNSLAVDMTALPHLLIAGTTGSGKSVCINSIIVSILLTQRPDMVKLILVDPKMVEMNAFRELPHLMCPIVTEMKRAEQILEWLTVKMDERYALLAEARVRNIAGYNRLSEEQIYERFCPSNDAEKAKIPLRLPYLVIVIDELADLMMTSAKEVEGFIIRLAQKSRAVGIHIVLATQRPQATVVTGLIKSNLPSRISFRVAARMDSRIVLDQNGAEALLGQGDMLFLQPGTSELIRAQGTFLSDGEIRRLMKYVKEVSKPSYHPELVQLNQYSGGDMEKDELFDEAVQVILETKRGSVSLLQRRLTIGYSRASRLIDQMAMAGIVGEYKGSQAREVLITADEFAAIKRQMNIDAAQGYSDMQENETQADQVAGEAVSTDETKTGSEAPAIQAAPEDIGADFAGAVEEEAEENLEELEGSAAEDVEDEYELDEAGDEDVEGDEEDQIEYVDDEQEYPEEIEGEPADESEQDYEYTEENQDK